MALVGRTAVAAVMVHVADWKVGVAWYRKAFADAVQMPVDSSDFGVLEYDGVKIEIVTADEKVAAGAAGSVVYWNVGAFEKSLEHFLSVGARLYRGPMEIGNGMMMCQVLDPWGNCIGLRGRGLGDG